MRGSWACDLLHMFAIFVETDGARVAGGAESRADAIRQQSVPTERSEER